jgi:hypothetical protein
MSPKQFLIAAALLVVTQGAAHASQSFQESGVLVCVTDKWAETVPEKGHKLVDAAMRCGVVPDSPALEKYAQDCTAKYEYLADRSWKGSGTCTNSYKSGDKSYESFEEGSHLQPYTYKKTGGTGRYAGASGGGTYMYEGVTDVVFGGRYKGELTLP